MKTIKKIILSGLVSLGFSQICFADLPLPCGWYAEGNIGLTNLSNISFGSGNNVSSSGFGLNANAGYKFMPFFAAEIGITGYSQSNIKSNTGGGSATLNSISYDLVGKAILPLGLTGTELFTKLGVAQVTSRLKNSGNGVGTPNGTNSATNYFLGAGAEYAFTPSTSMVGQWAMAKGGRSTGTYSLYSIGLSYMFA